MSSPTARRTMTELKAVGLVDFEETTNETAEKEIELKSEFHWFLDDEFAKLRGKFVPTDYREYLVKNGKKNEDICNYNDEVKENLKEKTTPSTHNLTIDKNELLEISSKPEGATYTCPNCNEVQYSYCWELHKQSCKVGK